MVLSLMPKARMSRLILTIPAGMTDVYQPCDTHINGVLKEKLTAAWCDKAAENPDYVVPLSEMIQQCSTIVQRMPAKLVQKSFTESLFDPAMEAVVGDVLNGIVDTIVHTAAMHYEAMVAMSAIELALASVSEAVSKATSSN